MLHRTEEQGYAPPLCPMRFVYAMDIDKDMPRFMHSTATGHLYSTASSDLEADVLAHCRVGADSFRIPSLSGSRTRGVRARLLGFEEGVGLRRNPTITL